MAQNDGGSAERRSRPSSKAVAAAQSGLFVCNGEYWTLGYNNADFSLKDIKGLGYIQRLLQHPGEEFHSLDLLNGPGGGAELESADKASCWAAPRSASVDLATRARCSTSRPSKNISTD